MARANTVHFKRLAVLPGQITEWNLPTRPTKTSDSRSRNFGGDVSVELDAIEPDRLRSIVTEPGIAPYARCVKNDNRSIGTVGALFWQIGGGYSRSMKPRSSVRLEAVIPSDWRARLGELAEQHGISVATLVRLAVKRLLDEGVKLSVPPRRD
jgi:hypothetical protein